MVDASAIAGGTIAQCQRAQGIISSNISNAGVAGAKADSVTFKSKTNGSAVMETMRDVVAQGQIVPSNSSSLSISGNGFMPARNTDGQIVFTRRCISTGLNNDNQYVTDSGLVIQGWNTEADGTILGKNLSAIGNQNDLTQLVDIDFTEYTTYSQQSSKVTINNILQQTLANGSSVEQSVNFYDSIGGSHPMTLKWTKIGTVGSGGIANCTSSGGTVLNGADKWQLTITYDGTNVAKQNTSGGANFDAGNAPMIYMKNGKVIAYTDQNTVTPNDITTMPKVNIPFTATPYADVTLDLGLSLNAANSFSTIIESASSEASLVGIADGSALVQMMGWNVKPNGQVEVNYPTASRLVFTLPIATFADPNSLTDEEGYFSQTTDSGPPQLQVSGKGGAGVFNPGTYEASTSDPTAQLIQLMPINNQISAASKLLSMTQEVNKQVLGAF